MAAAAGFRFDFDRFLQMGRIGASAAIELPSDSATWGDFLTLKALSDEPAELAVWSGHAPAANVRPLQTWRIDGEQLIRWHCTEDVVFKLLSGHDVLDEAALQVIRPAAHLQVLSPNNCLRYEAATLNLRLKYAVEAFLCLPGQAEQRLALEPPQFHTSVQHLWSTQVCGFEQASVRALGVDGQWRVFDLELTVLPRPVVHTVQAQGQGTYLIEVSNAEPNQLELPLLGSWQPLLHPTFVLTYHGMSPMLARVHALNDAGNLESIEIELQHDVVWQDLPGFTQALGWSD